MKGTKVKFILLYPPKVINKKANLFGQEFIPECLMDARFEMHMSFVVGVMPFHGQVVENQSHDE